MSYTLSGADFKAFFADESIWRPGFYCDDLLVHVDGQEYISDRNDNEVGEIGDLSTVNVEEGMILQGGESAPQSFVEVLRAWHLQRRSVTVSVRIPRDKLEEFTALLNRVGASLLN